MDRLSPERRSESMRRIRCKDTSPEMAVRRLVHGMGFRYRLHVQALPGRPDMVFPRLKKIIQVQGCFWHQHRGCTQAHIPKTRIQYWRPKLKKNQRRDRANEKRLRKEGWDVLTIWECEAKALGTVASRISEFLSPHIADRSSDASRFD
ncbi:MAG: very short patch repair endonuclease [Bryobacteraceae bacterium]